MSATMKDAVAVLQRIATLIAETGCDCECFADWDSPCDDADGHDDACEERCAMCRVEACFQTRNTRQFMRDVEEDCKRESER